MIYTMKSLFDNNNNNNNNNNNKSIFLSKIHCDLFILKWILIEYQ